ncbi:MAG: hypothetical protein HN348_15030 [Proteobacteria bacterium]|nr:hypothetical protein [Pseudomonadota bacterium]
MFESYACFWCCSTAMAIMVQSWRCDTTALERITEDLEKLSANDLRYAGSVGERAMLHNVKALLPTTVKPRIEGFVAHTSPELVLVVHSALLLLAGLLGFGLPELGTLLCAIVTASLVAEGTGHLSLIRWPMPKAASYNLVLGQAAENPLGTIVISAPLDIPRWRPARRWIHRPLQAVFAAALFVTIMLALRTMAEPWGRFTLGIYIVSLLILATTMALSAVLRRRQVPGEVDASGPAVLLELQRRFLSDPIPGVEVWTVFTGCGFAYQGGMEAFLAQHGARLAAPALVVALHEPGRDPVGVAVSEGPLWSQHHRSTGPALVERLRWAGIEIPMIDKAEPTDARAAMIQDFRALALCGSYGPSNARTAARTADLAETVVRWFGEDLAGVAGSMSKLQRLVQVVEAQPAQIEADLRSDQFMVNSGASGLGRPRF